MFAAAPYSVRFHSFRGQWTGLPQWARAVVGVFALPGLLLLLLSILVFAVSLLALLLLTVPVYTLLRRVTGSGSPLQGQSVSEPQSPVGVKRVEATVVE